MLLCGNDSFPFVGLYKAAVVGLCFSFCSSFCLFYICSFWLPSSPSLLPFLSHLTSTLVLFLHGFSPLSSHFLLFPPPPILPGKLTLLLLLSFSLCTFFGCWCASCPSVLAVCCALGLASAAIRFPLCLWRALLQSKYELLPFQFCSACPLSRLWVSCPL